MCLQILDRASSQRRSDPNNAKIGMVPSHWTALRGPPNRAATSDSHCSLIGQRFVCGSGFSPSRTSYLRFLSCRGCMGPLLAAILPGDALIALKKGYDFFDWFGHSPSRNKSIENVEQVGGSMLVSARLLSALSPLCSSLPTDIDSMRKSCRGAVGDATETLGNNYVGCDSLHEDAAVIVKLWVERALLVRCLLSRTCADSICHYG